jgi:DNA helicase-2/ATP-dependent DNA helicase PcrA
MAALSFTRVGGQEIRRELGHDPDHPHFIGTLDAFLFRYVVRPFLKQIHPTWPHPRLIPAEWSPHHWRKGPGGLSWEYRGQGGARATTYNLFDICFIDEDNSGPVLASPRRQGGIELVAPNDRAGLVAAKRQNWQRLGWLTHADAALLASEILSDEVHGTAVKLLVLQRFPFLIVDELQDTGFFLGKAVHILLNDPRARGILVGDPNQAIYEFNGARPALFAGFEGLGDAARLPLGNSQRCGALVVAAASHVKESNDHFGHANGNNGRAFLVQYGDMSADVPRIVSTIRTRFPEANAKIITRQSKTVEELSSCSAEEGQSLYCPALTHAYRAVKAFRQGRNVRGLSNMRVAIELAIFGHEGVPDELV